MRSGLGREFGHAAEALAIVFEDVIGFVAAHLELPFQLPSEKTTVELECGLLIGGHQITPEESSGPGELAHASAPFASLRRRRGDGLTLVQVFFSVNETTGSGAKSWIDRK